MGVTLNCENEGTCMTYSDWNFFRESIIKATFEYIYCKIQVDLEMSKNAIDEEDENYIDINSIYFSYKEIIENILKQDITTVNQIITLMNKSGLDIYDTFTYFDINGLLVLCNKNDCEGCYSPGNSHDICILLNLIEMYIHHNIPYYDKIKAIFTESYDKEIKVVIS